MLYEISQNDTCFYSKDGQHPAPGLSQCIYCRLLDYLDFHNLDHQSTGLKQRYQITQKSNLFNSTDEDIFITISRAINWKTFLESILPV